MDGTNWNLQDHPHIHGEHHLGPGPRRPLQDHPHIHGEHRCFRLSIPFRLGSPPYTWGAPLLDLDKCLETGITPIYMGSTHRVFIGDVGDQDHPHIHGEHR